MTVVHHTCGSCGRDLGEELCSGGEHFGISDNSVSRKEVTDPDCESCNPNYWKSCKKCGEKSIDKDGKCRNCGTVNTHGK